MFLALELMSFGTEVLGIDADEEIGQSLNGELTQVVRTDSTKVEALRQRIIAGQLQVPAVPAELASFQAAAP